ncbi:MAG TPA: site-2 protease family protein [Candidatus Limnocylindrales bacterium]
MNGGIALGRAFGTEIRIHWSWIPVLAILSVFFGIGLDSQAGPQWPAGLAWATAIATAVLVFGSVVLHELGHVAVARRSGIGGNVVVVQLLGGTYVMELRAVTPGQQFRAAVVGPLVSIVLVVVFGAVAVVATVGYGSADTGPSWLQAIDFAAFTIGLFNLFLVVVNLIPGYPMDGGQLVHAIAWRRSRDRRKANGTVSRVGRFVGFILLVLGAGLAVGVDLLPGLGLIVAGWVLLSSSRILERQGFLQTLTSGLRVVDAIDPESARVPPQLTLDVFAPEYMGARLGGAALVESSGELLGLIGQAQIRRIPKRNWPTTRTDHVMVPIANVPRADPEADLWPVLEVLERSGQDALLVGSIEPDVRLMTRRSAARLIHERAQEQVRLKKLADSLVGLGRRRPPAAPIQAAAPLEPPDADAPREQPDAAEPPPERPETGRESNDDQASGEGQRR